MPHENVGEILSLGVDWITVVGRDEPVIPNLSGFAMDLLHAQALGGFQVKGWGMAGFQGFAASGVQFGVRDEEVIVRLSGDLAHNCWRRAYEMANNCTRVDFECTTRTVASAARRIERSYAAARRHSRRKTKGPAVTIIRCTDGGRTVYLGKRQSMIYGRIYDKGVESREAWFLEAVRHEIEMKGKLANQVMRHLVVQSTPRDTIAARLSGFFSERGSPLGISDVCLLMPVVPRCGSTHSGLLRWLQEQVGPSTRRLVRAGFADDVLGALGLSIVDGELQVGPSSQLRVA